LTFRDGTKREETRSSQWRIRGLCSQPVLRLTRSVSPSQLAWRVSYSFVKKPRRELAVLSMGASNGPSEVTGVPHARRRLLRSNQPLAPEGVGLGNPAPLKTARRPALRGGISNPRVSASCRRNGSAQTTRSNYARRASDLQLASRTIEDIVRRACGESPPQPIIPNGCPLRPDASLLQQRRSIVLH